MGRAKLPMNNIMGRANPRSDTFRKRRKGLKKKASEFSILCGVDTCFICFGPNGDLETWPEDRSACMAVIKRFQSLSKDDQDKKKQNLSSFLTQRIMKVREDLLCKRKENAEILYPSWDDRLADFSSDRIEALTRHLDWKISTVRERIELEMASVSIKEGGEARAQNTVPYPMRTSDFRPLCVKKPMGLEDSYIAMDPINQMGLGLMSENYTGMGGVDMGVGDYSLGMEYIGAQPLRWMPDGGKLLGFDERVRRFSAPMDNKLGVFYDREDVKFVDFEERERGDGERSMKLPMDAPCTYEPQFAMQNPNPNYTIYQGSSSTSNYTISSSLGPFMQVPSHHPRMLPHVPMTQPFLPRQQQWVGLEEQPGMAHVCDDFYEV
ncbi:hypothetical protein AMTRI_Chr03g45270 [Amborella trichopoda]